MRRNHYVVRETFVRDAGLRKTMNEALGIVGRNPRSVLQHAFQRVADGLVVNADPANTRPVPAAALTPIVSPYAANATHGEEASSRRSEAA